MPETHAAEADQNEPAVDQSTVRRAAWAGLIGTALEQYDFVV